jgi:hypothetical protein
VFLIVLSSFFVGASLRRRGRLRNENPKPRETDEWAPNGAHPPRITRDGSNLLSPLRGSERRAGVTDRHT